MLPCRRFSSPINDSTSSCWGKSSIVASDNKLFSHKIRRHATLKLGSSTPEPANMGASTAETTVLVLLARECLRLWGPCVPSRRQTWVCDLSMPAAPRQPLSSRLQVLKQPLLPCVRMCLCVCTVCVCVCGCAYRILIASNLIFKYEYRNQPGGVYGIF